MPGRVALVTDSTSGLPPESAEQWGIGVVQTRIQINGRTAAESQISKRTLIQALEQRLEVSTAEPDPAAFLRIYQEQAARGADEVVSVHVSAGQSKTFHAAQQAAAHAGVPVHVIDSRTTGMSLGYAVLAAARVAGAGGGGRRVLAALARRLDGSCELVYVDTLEYLRRGGRIGAAAFMVGKAMSVKPLLTMEDGVVKPAARVLGADRALRRLVDIAVRKANGGPVDVAIEHFGAAARAARVYGRLRNRLPQARQITLTETSATLGVHVGPGAVAVSISPV